MNRVIIIVGFFAFIIVTISCETTKSFRKEYCVSPWDEYFSCYDDSLKFSYSSSLSYSKGKEIVNPAGFSLILPYGIRSFRFIGSDEFVFYYNHNQIVYLKISSGLNSNLDIYKSYTPSLGQIDSIVHLMDSDIGKFKNIKPKSSVNRINQLCLKKGSLIMLYNIKVNEIEDFINISRSYNILDQ